jgi:hypothetical protein
MKKQSHWPKVRIIAEDNVSRILRVSLSLTDAWYEVEVQGVPQGGCFKTEHEASAVRDAAVWEVLSGRAA